MERNPDSALVDDVFYRRWSPRSFSDKPVSDEQLAALFEAARWTPSWMNGQPWVFLYETDGPDRSDLEAIINEFNRYWAAQAPVIGLIISRPAFEGYMGRTSEFDTGAATMSLQLQATKMGLITHLMGGIDLDLAHEKTGLGPDEATMLCAFALGYQGDGSNLSEEHQQREQPSTRMPVSQFAFKGLTPRPRPAAE